MLQKLGALCDQGSAWAGLLVERPFEAGVTHVDGQESHVSIIRKVGTQPLAR
jgi:hypothetical protein